MNLSTYSDDESLNRTLRCECGRPKVRALDSCDRCTYLDGGRGEHVRIISVLRTAAVWLTQDELCTMLGRRPGGLHIPLTELLESGRVIRQEREVDPVQASIRCRYGTGIKNAKTGGSTCYEYALAMRRRR